jgi:RND family efflux transporter MFP subunit
MKPTFLIKIFASVFIMVSSSCSTPPTTTPVPTISLDTSNTLTPSQVQASAVAVPAKESHLSFVIAGLVEDVYVAEGDQVQAGQALVKLDTSELEYEVIAAEAALTSAIVDVKLQSLRNKEFNFRTFKFVHVSPPAEKILAAESRVEQSRFALEVAEATLAQGTLVAPFEGTVVEVNISPGEYVQPAQLVIVLADLEKLRIETTDLSELDVTDIEIGQLATVFVDALEAEYPGKVIAISPIADTIGGDVVFKVTVELEQQPPGLLWGMSADVRINIE